MVIYNYEGETCRYLGEILVDLAVGTRVRPTLFIFISPRPTITYCYEENGSMGLESPFCLST